MCQFCNDLRKLQDTFTNDNDYLKYAQEFNIKHKELLKNDENYTNLENIDLDEKIIDLISIAYNLKRFLLHTKKEVFLLKPELNEDKIETKNIPQELREKIHKSLKET
ncbi:1092_t:CDS:1 [Gigaspora margarita]|uniref:1092_t:CDS:1 n=1 Tax=Gigaspora margarita TaxID=4874 RepID=A0ABN7WLD5_GIGMA|nr:1092_t:CDS:1 [Gigaspora margarita]